MSDASNGKGSATAVVPMGAKTHIEPGKNPQFNRPAGDRDRDADQGAGVQSGLSEKMAIPTGEDYTGLLGKEMHEPMGTPPWEEPDIIDAGGGHKIKNG